MTINLTITVGLDEATKEWIMSKLSDAIASANTHADAAIGRVQTDLTSLKAQIATLQAQIDAGGASQSDLDALTALQTKLDALDPTSPVTLPPSPAPVPAGA